MNENTITLDLTNAESTINNGALLLCLGALLGIVANFSNIYLGFDCRYILTSLSVLAGVGLIGYGIGIGQNKNCINE